MKDFIIKTLNRIGLKIVDSEKHCDEINILIKRNWDLEQDIKELVVDPDSEKSLTIKLSVESHILIMDCIWSGHGNTNNLDGIKATATRLYN